MATPADPASMSKRRQYVETYRLTKKVYRWIGLWMLAAFVLGGALGFLLFWILPGSGVVKVILMVIGTLLFAVLSAMVVLARYAPKAAYAQMAGRPGAPVAALRILRRGWRVDEMVAFNKQQDLVHRVVGPPGIVLVGEGNPNRLRPLMANERRRHERVVSEVPVHEVVVGDGDGQVPLPRLVKHVRKLGRNVKPAELTEVLGRLRAMDAAKPRVPLPKGPIPTSTKGLRGNLRGR